MKEITDGIASHIWRQIVKSIEKDNKETYHELMVFVRDIIEISINKRALDDFKEYINIPADVYSISFERQKANPSFSLIKKINSAQHLKSIIQNDVIDNFNPTNDNKTEFYYWSFYAFNRLFYYTIQNRDLITFEVALSEFDTISKEGSYFWYVFELENVRNDPERKLELEEQIKSFINFNSCKRHVLIGIKSWLLELYNHDMIDKETTKKIIKDIKIEYDEPNQVLYDILDLRDRSNHTYMDWYRWIHEERELNSKSTQLLPLPQNWLTFGFLIEQITHYAFFINYEKLDLTKIRSLNSLYTDLKGMSDYVLEQYYIWSEILGKGHNEVDNTIKNILSNIEILIHKVTNLEDQDLRKVPLDEKEVSDFKDSVGKVWRQQASIRAIFHNDGIVEENIPIINNMGSATLLKKTMFISENHPKFNKIYNTSSLGGIIGQLENDLFFKTIIEHENLIEVQGASLITVIDDAMTRMKSVGFDADLIIIDNQYYRNKDLMQDKRFVPKYDYQDSLSTNPFLIGKLNDIPIYYSFSNFIKNRALICSFKNAFRLLCNTNPAWFDCKLNVQISEIDDNEAKARFQTNPSKFYNIINGDKVLLNEDEAIVRIQSDVKILIESQLAFEILNSNSYVIGQIIQDRMLK